MCDEMFGVTEDSCTIELVDDMTPFNSSWTRHIVRGLFLLSADLLSRCAITSRNTLLNAALSKLNEHQSHVCCTTSDLCLRCVNSGHSSKECLLPTRAIAGTCPCCYLPTSIGKQHFHLNGFGMCTLKDAVLKQACSYMEQCWPHDRAKVPEHCVTFYEKLVIAVRGRYFIVERKNCGSISV